MKTYIIEDSSLMQPSQPSNSVLHPYMATLQCYQTLIQAKNCKNHNSFLKISKFIQRITKKARITVWLQLKRYVFFCNFLKISISTAYSKGMIKSLSERLIMERNNIMDLNEIIETYTGKNLYIWGILILFWKKIHYW